MPRRVLKDDLPAHRKFGYEHSVFMREMHERLCELRGLDPTKFHAEVYFDSSWAYSEIERRKPTLRQRQEAARAKAPPPPPSNALTPEEIAYLLARLAGVNDPVGQSAAAKLTRMT